MWPTVPKQDTYYDTVVRWQNPKIMEKLAMSAKKNFFYCTLRESWMATCYLLSFPESKNGSQDGSLTGQNLDFFITFVLNIIN